MSTSSRTPLSRTHRTLVAAEVLLALGAYAGGIGLMTGFIDLGTGVEKLPFGSAFFAGFALTVINGILPTVAVVATLRRREDAAFDHLLVGLALMGWIVVQVGFLGPPVHWLQAFYFLYGAAITVLALAGASGRMHPHLPHAPHRPH